MTYDNVKSHKKAVLHLQSRIYIFGKNTGGRGSQTDPQSAYLGLQTRPQITKDSNSFIKFQKVFVDKVSSFYFLFLIFLQEYAAKKRLSISLIYQKHHSAKQIILQFLGCVCVTR